MTLASHWKPRSRRQLRSAHRPRLKIMACIPSRVRDPFVRSVRCRTVAKLNSITFEVPDPRTSGCGAMPGVGYFARQRVLPAGTGVATSIADLFSPCQPKAEGGNRLL